MAMITIKNSGIIEPFGLKFLGESKMQFIAPTRDITESADEFDGEIDFGTELKCGSWMLVGVTSEGLSNAQKEQLKRQLSWQLNMFRNYGDYLVYENDNNKRIYIQLEGRAEIEEYPSWFKLSIPLKTAPFWESVNENYLFGDGVISNNGTMDIPIIIEVKGPVTNPKIIIGNETIKFAGVIKEDDTLTINTENKTARVETVNALDNYNDAFPYIPPGTTTVINNSNSELIIRWRDRWF